MGKGVRKYTLKARLDKAYENYIERKRRCLRRKAMKWHQR